MGGHTKEHLLCEKCGNVAHWNSYFGKYVCLYCGWSAEKQAPISIEEAISLLKIGDIQSIDTNQIKDWLEELVCLREKLNKIYELSDLG